MRPASPVSQVGVRMFVWGCMSVRGGGGACLWTDITVSHLLLNIFTAGDFNTSLKWGQIYPDTQACIYPFILWSIYRILLFQRRSYFPSKQLNEFLFQQINTTGPLQNLIQPSTHLIIYHLVDSAATLTALQFIAFISCSILKKTFLPYLFVFKDLLTCVGMPVCVALV